MCVYASLYIQKLIYIWICTHIMSIDHRIMFHWKPAHRGNVATWNQEFDILTQKHDNLLPTLLLHVVCQKQIKLLD